MEKKELGKIAQAFIGYGGYQGAMFGLNLQFDGNGWRIGNNGHYMTWGISTKCSERRNWSEEDRDNVFSKTMRKANELCIDAKVKSIGELIGIPVEVTIENGHYKSFRILKEVL